MDAPPVPVEIAAVAKEAVADEVFAVGTLRSNEAVMIRSEIAGRIAAIGFGEGSAVRKGDVLFTLDDAIPAAELKDAEASLALSQRNFERARELFSRRFGTERTLDEARAALDSDSAKVELARARLGKTRIAAPFAGIVGLRRVSVGDYITIGQDLVNLEDLNPIKADFRVPERYLPALAPGQTLRVTVDAFPGRVFTGEVAALDPMIDPEGRSIAVRARLPNPDGVLRPGLFARVNLVLHRRAQALTIPETAVVPRGEERFVYRIDGDRAVLTRVDLGERRAGRVEVTAGLNAGDEVVTAGHLRLRDGARVRAAAAPAAGS
jgi:membrane fusion protein (multidrug efflux system)